MMDNEVYLGDGVYAEYDGYAIVLKANDQENPTDVIKLEPDVLSALYRFVDRVKEKANEKNDNEEYERCGYILDMRLLQSDIDLDDAELCAIVQFTRPEVMRRVLKARCLVSKCK